MGDGGAVDNRDGAWIAHGGHTGDSFLAYADYVIIRVHYAKLRNSTRFLGRFNVI